MLSAYLQFNTDLFIRLN